MDAERYNAAYRTALGFVLIYVLWMIVPHAIQYGSLIAGGVRRNQAAEAMRRQKLGATELAVMMRDANRLGEDSQFRCEPASRDWDYICSYIPTALPSKTRLHFGVNVDAKRRIAVSPIVPVGNTIPPPQ